MSQEHSRELPAAAAAPLPYEVQPPAQPPVQEGERVFYDSMGRRMVMPVNQAGEPVIPPHPGNTQEQ